MAVPKRKTSKARRDSRRSANNNLTAPTLVECPQCHELKLPHAVCKKRSAGTMMAKRSSTWIRRTRRKPDIRDYNRLKQRRKLLPKGFFCCLEKKGNMCYP